MTFGEMETINEVDMVNIWKSGRRKLGEERS